RRPRSAPAAWCRSRPSWSPWGAGGRGSDSGAIPIRCPTGLVTRGGAGGGGTRAAHTVRTGICIVGGDICRSSDAAAAGLEPCTVRERSDGGGATLSLAWLRLGESKGLTVTARSDGSVVVTQARERKDGAGAGIGVEASPLGIEFGIEGAIDATLASGAVWEFPDAASAAAFLAGRTHPPPTWRFGDAGEVLSAGAGARLGGGAPTRRGGAATGA